MTSGAAKLSTLAVRCALLLTLVFAQGCGNNASSRGKQLYQSCLLCHSTKEMQRGPILNGLPAWYTSLQLGKFKLGLRGSLPENRSEYLMGSIISILTNQTDISQIARYIASLPPITHLKTIKGDTQNGKLIYAKCLACHGTKAEGNRTLNSPPLNVQEDWYLLDQLRRYRQGLRGHHPRDLEGQSMALAVQSMTTEEFQDVVRYITEELNPLPAASP